MMPIGMRVRRSLVLLVLFPLLGCGRDDCDESLRVELLAGWEGVFHFEGEAAGDAFACRYHVRLWAETVQVIAEDCTGPVHLKVERFPDPEYGGFHDELAAVFPSVPEALDWSWRSEEPIADFPEPVLRTGRLQPGRRGDCRPVTAQVPEEL